MLCLHDVRIEDGEKRAQLDFVLITHKFIMILETKKLNGDIYINEAGEFVRCFKNNFGKVVKKEGIYSPIAQNDRHVMIFREFLVKNNLIKKIPVISGVVIANPKSIINRSKAPARIKKEIFKYDQITEVLNHEFKKRSNDGEMLEDRMKDISYFLVNNNKEASIDYYKKYSLCDEDFLEDSSREKSVEAMESCNMEEYIASREEDETENIKEKTSENVIKNKEVGDKASNELYEKLKDFRITMARLANIKPYFIFNNETLDELVSLKPKNKDELLKIKGFGANKVEKYGVEIINIIKKLK